MNEIKFGITGGTGVPAFSAHRSWNDSLNTLRRIGCCGMISPHNERHPQLMDEIVMDKKVSTNTGIGLPDNRVIRKRIAARTIAIHLSALPTELQVFKSAADNDAYLTRYDLPDEVHLTASDGEKEVLSRDEAWALADKAGSKLEWDILPDSMAGRATALFSSTGQGVYANYGRPTMDFSGFFHDYVCAPGDRMGSSVMLGPIFIAMDTASAIGFTAIGHITRDARLTDKTVISDVVSTGVYEGTTSWTSAKLGVFTGARAIRFAATLPVPGAHLAAVPIGFLVGAITAIFTKRFANKAKDSAIDAVHQSVKHSEAAEAVRMGALA